MKKNITIEEYSFWKNNRFHLLFIVAGAFAALYGIIICSYTIVILNTLSVLLNGIMIYSNQPPKWVCQDAEEV